MIDRDLAELYGVPTKYLNQQVRRVRLRQLLYTHKELADKLKELEGRVSNHDKDIQEIVQSIKELVTPLPEKRKKIGFLK